MSRSEVHLSRLSRTLRNQFGDIDIHVFDALLQGYWRPEHRFLDAGCGTGRNLPCFLDAGFDVWGLDSDDDALDVARELVKERRPDLASTQFRCAALENHDLPESHFDAVLCNAVLHFAEDREHFMAMLEGLWKTLAPNGRILIRLGSRIGMDGLVKPLGNGRFRQPDGAAWFLPSFEELEAAEKHLGAQRPHPLKTTWVERRRAMTTWWLCKR